MALPIRSRVIGWTTALSALIRHGGASCAGDLFTSERCCPPSRRPAGRSATRARRKWTVSILVRCRSLVFRSYPMHIHFLLQAPGLALIRGRYRAPMKRSRSDLGEIPACQCAVAIAEFLNDLFALLPGFEMHHGSGESSMPGDVPQIGFRIVAPYGDAEPDRASA